MEEGVRKSKTFLCVITDNGVEGQSYFSRPFCLKEVAWAVKYNKPIVPVIHQQDKKRVGEFIKAAQTAGEEQYPAIAKTAGGEHYPWPDFGQLNMVRCDAEHA